MVMSLILTIDTDWACPDEIKPIADILAEKHIKATWFVTDAIANNILSNYGDLFEIGWHPNCLLGSTQGNTENNVIEYLKSIMPNSISMRTHSLYYNGKWIRKCGEAGIKNDVSIFIPPDCNLRPFTIQYGPGIWVRRIAYHWEDDIIPLYKLPENGIVNFHPATILHKNRDIYPIFMDVLSRIDNRHIRDL